MNGASTTETMPQMQINPGLFPSGVPMFLIPATSFVQAPQMQNPSNPGVFFCSPEQEAKPFSQQSLFFKNNAPVQQANNTPIFVSQPMFSSVPSIFSNLSSFKPAQNGYEMNNGMNWNNQLQQPFQSNQPIILVSNPKQNGQNPQMTQMTQMPGNFMQPANFGNGGFLSHPSQNGNGMSGLASQVQPLQIQYMTSLYCPYSNNNIFSGFPPTATAQNGQSLPISISGKPFMGMEQGGANQGHMMPGMNGVMWNGATERAKNNFEET